MLGWLSVVAAVVVIAGISTGCGGGEERLGDRARSSAATSESTSTAPDPSLSPTTAGAVDTVPGAAVPDDTAPGASPGGQDTPGPPGSSVAGREDAGGKREVVIVDLRVEHRPEHELSREELARQRARIEAAQDQVLRDLGDHGTLSRRLTETAQMAVSVDAEGRRILAGHPLVARVHENRPEAPDSTS